MYDLVLSVCSRGISSKYYTHDNTYSRPNKATRFYTVFFITMQGDILIRGDYDIFYTLTLLGVSVLALIVGGIPVGRIIAAYYHIDITKIWSGNHGATNIYRALGMRWAIITALLDMCKWAVIVGVTQLRGFDVWQQVWIAVVVVAGSIWSIYLWWAGGKGVATAYGTLLMLVPVQAVILLATRLIGIKGLRIMSLTNVILVCSLPLLLGYRLWWIGTIRGLTYMVLLVYTHRTNISRLWVGNEGRL